MSTELKAKSYHYPVRKSQKYYLKFIYRKKFNLFAERRIFFYQTIYLVGERFFPVLVLNIVIAGPIHRFTWHSHRSEYSNAL